MAVSEDFINWVLMLFRFSAYASFFFTFAIVISSENHKDVFEKGDYSESPEDKWKNTIDFFIGIWMLDVFSKSASVNVKRRDAQIAIDDTKALIGQYKNRFPRILLKETQNCSNFNNWLFSKCRKMEKLKLRESIRHKPLNYPNTSHAQDP